MTTTALLARWVGRSTGFALMFLGVAYLANQTPLNRASDLVFTVVVAITTSVVVTVLAQLVSAGRPPTRPAAAQDGMHHVRSRTDRDL